MKKNKILNVFIIFMVFCVDFSYANCIKRVVFLRHGEKNSVSAGLINCQGENRAIGLSDPNGHLLSTYGTPAAIYAANPNISIPDNGCFANGCCLYQRPYMTIAPTAIQLQIPINVTYGVGYLGNIFVSNGPVINCSSAPPANTDYLSLPIPPNPPNKCGSGNTNGDVDLARDILKNESYCNQTIFVAWEHSNIPVVTYNFFYILGLNPVNKIPKWPYGVCDSSYTAAGICTPEEVGQCSRGWNYNTLYVVSIDQSNPYTPSISIHLDTEDLNYPSTICPV